jgi:hypothetical protein
MCKSSQMLGLQNGKRAAVGQFSAKCHSAIGQEIEILCTVWSRNHHVIYSTHSYVLIYVHFSSLPL